MDVNSNNQSGPDEQMMDILLVFDKEKKTINAVKGVDENGELQTVPPKQEHNNDFLKVDKQGNALENFLKNFFNRKPSVIISLQMCHPYHTQMCRKNNFTAL